MVIRTSFTLWEELSDDSIPREVHVLQRSYRVRRRMLTLCHSNVKDILSYPYALTP